MLTLLAIVLAIVALAYVGAGAAVFCVAREERKPLLSALAQAVVWPRAIAIKEQG